MHVLERRRAPQGGAAAQHHCATFRWWPLPVRCRLLSCPSRRVLGGGLVFERGGAVAHPAIRGSNAAAADSGGVRPCEHHTKPAATRSSATRPALASPHTHSWCHWRNRRGGEFAVSSSMLHHLHHHQHHHQQLWGSVSGSSSSSSSSSSPCAPAREARVRRRFPPLCVSRVSANGSPSSSSPQQQQQQQQQPTAAAEATHITLSPPASTAKPSSLGVGSEEEEGVGPPGSRAGGSSEGRAAAESIQGGGEGEGGRSA